MVVLVLSILIGFPVYIAAEETLGKEMLVNGDFEQGNPPEKWATAFDVVLSQDINPHSGKYCLKIVYQQEGKGGYARQDVYPVPGKKYKLTLWYKCEPGSTIRIAMYDHTNGKNLSPEHKTDYIWTKHEKTITIPAGCKSAGVLLYPFGTGSIVWCDDVSFREIEEATD